MHRVEYKQANQSIVSRSVICVNDKGKNAGVYSPKDEYKDFCVCELKCTCIEMMWSVNESMWLYTFQVKYYT